MDLEIVILSKVSHKGKDRYHITYIMWNLKYGTHKLIYKQKLTGIENRPAVAMGEGG